MGAAALLETMLNSLTPAERAEREERCQKGIPLFTLEEMKTYDAALRKAESDRYVLTMKAHEAERQRRKHAEEQRAREQRELRRKQESGLLD